MFDSDAELMSHVRGQVGVNRNSDLPEQALKEELERAKYEINREVRERLNNNGSLNFTEARAFQKALENLLKLRAKARVKANQQARGSGVPAHSDAPVSVSSMRRHNFGEQTMNHWRDRMILHLNKITE